MSVSNLPVTITVLGSQSKMVGNSGSGRSFGGGSVGGGSVGGGSVGDSGFGPHDVASATSAAMKQATLSFRSFPQIADWVRRALIDLGRYGALG